MNDLNGYTLEEVVKIMKPKKGCGKETPTKVLSNIEALCLAERYKNPHNILAQSIVAYLSMTRVQ